ncbi:hypothetical protein DICVIV_02639 [Dictyocaulus viviparus]|uniref:C2H2-type domain-containing protein n=1 Tax=Dictyocaulus viviparus TaxID=29172 RepID=A0A0D8Y4S9_DICVI|nr:hypothetical protein DICVIV_02639 [Dictyocaulus viviparus]
MPGTESYLNYYKQCSPKKQQIFDTECGILLECKACGEIFRSVVFFISHKRTFCRVNTMDAPNSRDKPTNNNEVNNRRNMSRRGRKNLAKQAVSAKQVSSRGRGVKMSERRE